MTNKALAKLYEIPELKGKETSGRDELEYLYEKTGDEVFGKTVELRQLHTVINNYIPNWEPDENGRVHTTWGFKASSGQLDSSAPNVLNISKHTKIGKRFRKIIVAPEGTSFVECVTPDTRILTWDLRWVTASSLQIGEEIIGFDEYPLDIHRVRPTRYLRKAQVLESGIIERPCIKIVTTQGEITVSEKHYFTRRGSNVGSILGKGWIPAFKVKPGMKLSFFTSPWMVDNDNFNVGWLAGFMDGEGWISGVLLDRAELLLKELGFFCTRHTGNSLRMIKLAIHHEQAFAGLRAIGMIRPIRLLNTIQARIEGTATWEKYSKAAEVLSVEKVGVKDVVAIRTTTKTYISNGFLSHNCDKKSFHVATLGYLANDKDYLRFASLDPHSIFTSYIMPSHWGLQPVSFNWSDSDIKLACKEIKKRSKEEKEKQGANGIDLRQDVAKPCVLGNQLGLGPYKLWYKNRRSIKSKAHAEELQGVIARLFPKVERWKEECVELASRQTYLVDAWGHIQFFFEIYTWTKNKWTGRWEKKRTEEAEKALALMVQGTAFGMLKYQHWQMEEEGLNEKYNFINSIHDSLMFMPEDKYKDNCIEDCNKFLNAPCSVLVNEATGPEGLVVKVEVSVGKNLLDMEEV